MSEAQGLTDWRLAATGLVVRRGGRTVLDGVSLTIAAGDCVSIVGPNGSGKTTLLLTLLGLLAPAEGTVCLNGGDLRRLATRARGRFAGYVPQLQEAAPAFRVYDVVAGGRYPYTAGLGRLTPADRAAIGRALDRCGLGPLADRRFDTLSGGERQKTLIAAAMAQEPQVLFLDEPNTALDPAYQIELVRILRGWQAAGHSLVLVSHDLQLPAALGGRVVALRDGRVAAEGPAGDVLRPDVLAGVYGAEFAEVRTTGGMALVLPAWWQAG